MSDEELNRSLALFVCVVRKANGSKYPPKTLHAWYGCLNSALFERKEKDYETIQR